LGKSQPQCSRVPETCLHHDVARVRFAQCTTFDDKRQFRVEHVERIIYDGYRVAVIGSVPIKRN